MARRSSRPRRGDRRRRLAAAARAARGCIRPLPRPPGRPRRPPQVAELPLPLALALRARGELGLVQARELALLLAGAAMLALGSAAGALLFPPCVLAPESLSAWRRRARRLLQRIDTPPGEARRLLRLLDAPLLAWPSAVELAAAARALHDGTRTRLVEAHVHLAVGDAEAGLERYREVALTLAELPLHREVLLGLAASHLALGRYRLALGALDAAADAPEACVTELVGALVLAWRVGDERRALRAAARLDLQVDLASPDLARGLAWLRHWLTEPHAWSLAADLARTFRDGGASPTTRVVQLVLAAEPRA